MVFHLRGIGCSRKFHRANFRRLALPLGPPAKGDRYLRQGSMETIPFRFYPRGLP